MRVARAVVTSLVVASASLVAASLVAACGGEASNGARAETGGIRDVVVVLQGSSEPLPFDPRAGRVLRVTRELTAIVGHPIVLELDAALSPEMRASLEETVLATFENLVRELVVLKREDAEMFAEARRLERVTCKYDAIARESEGHVEDGGKVLVVRAPPDRFPLLERGVATDAIYLAHLDALDARWGEADPVNIPAREQAAYFAYMTQTRPGYGYVWSWKRRKQGDGTNVRFEHIDRIVRLASVVPARSPLEHAVRHFLLENAAFVGGGRSGDGGKSGDGGQQHPVVRAYGEWLVKASPAFDDEERLMLARAVLEHRSGICPPPCDPDATFPSFDWFAFGLSVFDEWVKEGAKNDLAAGPRGELQKEVLCPVKRMGEGEIRYGCSTFFAVVMRDDAARARLAATIAKRHDARLLELAILNPGTNEGAKTVALVEALTADDALFRQGVRLLFTELARRDDVRSALEEAAPRWWHDAPLRRGLALLVMARRWEHLDVYYGDHQWERFPAEFGGPVGRDVLASYLAEGPRAVEMAPKIWPALAKGPDRAALVARALPGLLALGAGRAQPALLLLRRRLCDDRDAAGFAAVRAELGRWTRAHPDDAPAAGAERDMAVEKCPKKK